MILLGYGIDTPEKKQATVKVYDADKYGRTVGVVKVGGTNINESLIKAGFAWQYRKYCKAKFCGKWQQLERKAKASSIGLWSENDPLAPWQWRKGKRNTSQVKKTSGKKVFTTAEMRFDYDIILETLNGYDFTKAATTVEQIAKKI